MVEISHLPEGLQRVIGFAAGHGLIRAERGLAGFAPFCLGVSVTHPALVETNGDAHPGMTGDTAREAAMNIARLNSEDFVALVYESAVMDEGTLVPAVIIEAQERSAIHAHRFAQKFVAPRHVGEFHRIGNPEYEGEVNPFLD